VLRIIHIGSAKCHVSCIFGIGSQDLTSRSSGSQPYVLICAKSWFITQQLCWTLWLGVGIQIEHLLGWFDLNFASVHTDGGGGGAPGGVGCEGGWPQGRNKDWLLQTSCTVILMSSIVRDFNAGSQNVALQPM
jgi:hypothetical protein